MSSAAGTEVGGIGARIGAAFNGHGRRAALMPYLMGGYPTLAGSLEIGRACADAGADLVELGIPFSDPLADGPVIAAAAGDALRAGATVQGVLDVCADLSQSIPVALMVYANVVLCDGPRRFADRAAEAGADGLIVPDLPFDEADELRDACDGAGVALIPLAAPSTPPDRLAAIGVGARGFVYTVSVAGITGERAALPPELPQTVERVRAATDLPVAVGFGVSTPDQAREVAAIADGVIVGTRVVRAAGEDGPAGVRALVEELGAALVR